MVAGGVVVGTGGGALILGLDEGLKEGGNEGLEEGGNEGLDEGLDEDVGTGVLGANVSVPASSRTRPAALFAVVAEGLGDSGAVTAITSPATDREI
jgi:hypothetical protein